MMRQIIEFNPETDVAEVDQFGFVNITKAIQNGYVPGNNSSVTLDFDGSDVDPSSIIGTPSDVFEAFRMQDKIMSDLKSFNKDSSSGSSYNKDEN